MQGKIIEYPFNKESIEKIPHDEWNENRPVVYIIKGKQHIYIGETSNVFRRTQDHLKNEERIKFLNTMFVVYDVEYNKSATLDIESQLIQYISAEDSFKLQNRNDGLRNHHYFDREKYIAKFEEIWKELQKKEIVYRDLNEIRNSDLFKYSPYKVLNEDQYNVVKSIYDEIKNTKEGTFLVKGEPGTGKSIVASYLIKYLKGKEETKKLKIGFVIPMTSLRNTFKKVFKNIEGVKSSIVIGPNDIAKDYNKENNKPYDIIIVDESHRLQKRKNITNYQSYDQINKKIGLSKESTQLDWILNLSKFQVLLYDSNQSIKPADVNHDDFNKIKNAKIYELKSQMRIKGGNQYLSAISGLFEGISIKIDDIKDYDFKIFNNFKSFREKIFENNKEHGLCRIVAGYARPRRSKKNPNEYDIEIEGIKLFRNSTNIDWVNSKKSLEEIGCIHTVQGYDLNYVGVILGEELSYDKEIGKLIINKNKYHDMNGRRGIDNQEELKRYIINIYKTLLTRGILGTYIYVVDENLRDYLKTKIPSIFYSN